MRVRDPNGPWKAHPDDARLLIARDPAGGDSGPFYRILPEGEIQNYDGVTIKLARPLEGCRPDSCSESEARFFQP